MLFADAEMKTDLYQLQFSNSLSYAPSCSSAIKQWPSSTALCISFVAFHLLRFIPDTNTNNKNESDLEVSNRLDIFCFCAV